MKTISLNGCRQGECFEANGTKKFDFSGNVPGCVHTDLAGTQNQIKLQLTFLSDKKSKHFKQ